jgi:hypothetical protein
MDVRRAALVLLLLVPPLAAQQVAPQNDSIRKEDLKADLFFLAHDLTQGRLVGTPGNALAAEFIKSRFERLGLVPAGPDGSFFQSFNLVVAALGADNSLESMTRIRSRRGCSRDRTTIRSDSARGLASRRRWCSAASTSPPLRSRTTTIAARA